MSRDASRGVLPHPVRLRDMILRVKLGANDALDINREFQGYLAAFGQTQKIGREILQKLATSPQKISGCWLMSCGPGTMP